MSSTNPNVIFLDFDGVLNSVRSTVAVNERRLRALGARKQPTDKQIRESTPEQRVRWHEQFEDNQWAQLDPIAVGLVERLCKEGPAVVVVSSTWRIGKPRSIEFQVRFEQLGFHIPVIGATPVTDDRHRGEEIEIWLKDNPINSYVILDDDSDMTREQKEKHFVHVSNQEGMLLKHYRAALRILNPQHSSLVQFDEYDKYPA